MPLWPPAKLVRGEEMEPPKVCELSEVRQLMLMPPRDRGCGCALMELCFEECGGGCTGVERGGDEAGSRNIRKVRG